VTKHQQNDRKKLKKFKNSSMKTVAEQSMSSQTRLGSAVEFAGDLNRKSEHAPHCSIMTTRSQLIPEYQRVCD
jgi:hypothetical protein